MLYKSFSDHLCELTRITASVKCLNSKFTHAWMCRRQMKHLPPISSSVFRVSALHKNFLSTSTLIWNDTNRDQHQQYRMFTHPATFKGFILMLIEKKTPQNLSLIIKITPTSNQLLRALIIDFLIVTMNQCWILIKYIYWGTAQWIKFLSTCT